MRLKPIALGWGAITLILSLIAGDYNQADSHLSGLYDDMLKANFSAAAKDIDEAIRLWPSNARYYTWSAYLRSQTLPPQCPRCAWSSETNLSIGAQSQIHEAIVQYSKALELNHYDAVAFHNRAWLEHMAGDNKTAGDDWQTAITIDPATAVFHLSYGMFEKELGNSQEAERQIEAAIELSPSVVDSPFFVRYQNDWPDEATRVLNESISKLENKLGQGRDPILEARLGKLYLSSKNSIRAIELLQDGATQLPNLALVWFNLGDAYASQGDASKAFDCYSKAQVIDQFLAGPYLRIGELYLRGGQKKLAESNFRLAIANWQRRTPITAAHNNRLYNGPRQRIDDLLPTTLVWFVTPCEVSAAYRGLVQISPGNADFVRRSHTCEELPSPHLCKKTN